MLLTNENYHSQEAYKEYLSVSRYKDFIGSDGRRGCEAMALAKMRGEWEQEKTIPLLVGSYVDAHFSGMLTVFKSQHPEILTQKGELRAEYKQANEIIARIESDDYFMTCMSGEKQRIFTADLFGAKWSVCVDSYVPGKAIVDLKIMKELRKSHWVKDFGHTTFIQFWGYLLQGAIYQRVTEIATGEKLPFLIAAASKEKVTDIAVVGFTQKELDDELSLVEKNVYRIIKLKEGSIQPVRCESCDYCRITRVLDHPIHHSELILNI